LDFNFLSNIDTIVTNVISNAIYGLTIAIPGIIYYLFINLNTKYRRFKTKQKFSFFSKYKNFRGVYYSSYYKFWTVDNRDISQEQLLKNIQKFKEKISEHNHEDVTFEINEISNVLNRNRTHKELLNEKFKILQNLCNQKLIDIKETIGNIDLSKKDINPKEKNEVIEIIVIGDKFYGFILPNKLNNYRRVKHNYGEKANNVELNEQRAEFRFCGEFYDNLMIGHWVDPIKPKAYFGALTFIQNTGNNIYGKWLGENENKKEIDTGNWGLEYKYPTVKEYKEKNNLKGMKL